MGVLVELLVVISILATLAVVVIPAYLAFFNSGEAEASSAGQHDIRWTPSLRQPEGQIKRVSHPYARFHHA